MPRRYNGYSRNQVERLIQYRGMNNMPFWQRAATAITNAFAPGQPINPHASSYGQGARTGDYANLLRRGDEANAARARVGGALAGGAGGLLAGLASNYFENRNLQNAIGQTNSDETQPGFVGPRTLQGINDYGINPSYYGIQYPGYNPPNTYDPNHAVNTVNSYLPQDNTPAYNGPVPVGGNANSGRESSSGRSGGGGAFGRDSGVFDNYGYTGANGSSPLGAINGWGPSSGIASRIMGGFNASGGGAYGGNRQIPVVIV